MFIGGRICPPPQQRAKETRLFQVGPGQSEHPISSTPTLAHAQTSNRAPGTAPQPCCQLGLELHLLRHQVGQSRPAPGSNLGLLDLGSPRSDRIGGVLSIRAEMGEKTAPGGKLSCHMGECVGVCVCQNRGVMFVDPKLGASKRSFVNSHVAFWR